MDENNLTSEMMVVFGNKILQIGDEIGDLDFFIHCVMACIQIELTKNYKDPLKVWGVLNKSMISAIKRIKVKKDE